MYSASLKIGFGDKALADIDAAIEGLKVKLEDFRELWPAVAKIAGRSFAENFARAMAVSGPWPPLTPRYLQQKIRQGYPAQILIRTRKLIRAATEISVNPRAHQLVIAEAKRFGFALVGEVGRYSQLHDRPGGVRGKRREHLVLNQTGTRQIFTEFTRWVNKKTKEIWGEA